MLKLPFGLRGESLLHVSEVERGLACDCVCPACGHPLVARKGPKVIHHFAHYKSSECAHAVETALHLAAKSVLETEGQIILPEVQIPVECNKESWRIPSRRIRFDKIKLEPRWSTVIPDVVIYENNRTLMIEIAVTHPVDEEKRQKLKQLGVYALEISLKRFTRNPTQEELRQEVVFSTQSKRWLHNPCAEAVKREVYGLAERKKHVQHDYAPYVYECPKYTDSCANVINDCLDCEYCIDAGLGLGGKEEVLCLGRRGWKSYEDFLKTKR